MNGGQGAQLNLPAANVEQGSRQQAKTDKIGGLYK